MFRTEKKYQADKNIRCLQHTLSVEDGKNFEEHSKKNKSKDERAPSKNSKNRRLSAREMFTVTDLIRTSDSH